jgi:hypothetical protein
MSAAGKRKAVPTGARLGVPSATPAAAAAVVPRNVRRSKFLSDIIGSKVCEGGEKMKGGGEGGQRALYSQTDD